MSRPRWYAERAPVTVQLPCGDQVHRVSWRQGRLILHDHDVAAEEVLMALGGQPCVCLVVRNTFRQLGTSRQPMAGRVVATARIISAGTTVQAAAPSAGASASPSESAGASASVSVSASATFGPAWRQTLRSAQSNAQLHQQLMQSMHSYLSRRHQIPLLLAEVVEQALYQRALRLSRQDRPPPTRPTAEERLQAAAVPALELTMRHAQEHHLRSSAALTVGCWKQAAGEPRILQGNLTSRGGFVAVSLPVAWLNRVWLRGLACVDGHFVLGVDAAAPATELEAEAVRWERHFGGHAAPVADRCSIRRRAGRWQLTW